MKVRRRTLLAVMAAAAAPLAAPAQMPIPLRLGASLDDGLSPVLYGLHAGIFARRGLDVTLTSATNGAALAAAIAAGAVDVAKSAMMSLLAAYAHGVRFKIVAGGTVWDTKAPTIELCVLASSAIRTPADLSDKTIAVGTLQSLDQMATQALVDQQGGRSGTMRFIEMPFSAMLGALQHGRADCASIANPVLQNVLESRQARTIGSSYDALGNGFLEAAWFCSAPFAERNHDTAERFADAFREAAAYTNAHHDATVPLLAAYAKLEPDVIRKMKRDTIATGPPAAAAIQPCIDAAAKYGYIAASFNAKELLLG